MQIAALFHNRFWLGYCALYLTFMVLLNQFENYSISEPLAILVILGLFFSGFAYFLTRASVPLSISVQVSRSQIAAIALYLVFLTGYLGWGGAAIKSVLDGMMDRSAAALMFTELIQKLVFFVLVPLFLFRKFFGGSFADFGFQLVKVPRQKINNLLVLLGMSLLFVLFNYLVGRGAAPIREGQFGAGQLMLGLPLAYLWLVIEVGLVEEFFFRAFLQTRLAAYFKSEITGIVLSCLLFGLAHAPGLILRGAGTITPVGESPSVLLGVGYSIVTLSVTGFCFGIIWSRTRNLLLVIMIHAAVDLLPGFAELAEAFNL